jgi:predicted lactoylglutathione lyase
MAQLVFINLPVKDLKKSKDFFAGLGYTFNEQFTDENAACMVVSEHIFVMLLVENYFKGFISTEIADAQKTTEVLVCLSADSKDDVNTLVDKAVKAGANEHREPQDHGFMYGRSFKDLDGHVWEFMWMDPSAVQQS